MLTIQIIADTIYYDGMPMARLVAAPGTLRDEFERDLEYLWKKKWQGDFELEEAL